MKSRSLWQSVSRLIDTILALFLILNCQSVYQNSTGVNFFVYEITAILIVVSAILKFSFNDVTYRNLKRFFSFFCIYIIYIIFIALFSVDGSLIISFFGRYGLFPFAAFNFFLNVSNNDKFYVFKKFVDWVVIITTISLFFWLIGSTFKIIKPNSVFGFDWGQEVFANSYFGLYFETQYVDWIGIDWFYRNTAIFVEGPMFCLVLILAIVFIHTCPLKFRHIKFKSCVLCFGLISTFSTVGLLFLGLIILFYFYRNKKLRNYLVVILPIILICSIYVLIKKSSTGSFSLRMDDYVAGFNTWIKKPIFGHGFGKFDAVIENMSRDENVGFSNSIFAVLVQGGIVYGLLFISPIIFGLFNGIKKKKHSLIFLSLCYTLLFVLIVFQTAFINIYVWSLIYFYPLKKEETRNHINISRMQKAENMVL